MPAANVNGTLDTLSGLRNQLIPVVEYGEDAIYKIISMSLEAHNRTTADVMDDLVEVTGDRLRSYGGTAKVRFDEVDEYGTARPAASPFAVPVGFPLRKKGKSLQWTRVALKSMMVNELADNVIQILQADAIAVRTDIANAIFGSSNYSFVDRLVSANTQITLPVKALVNADSAVMPTGPNGEYFDGSTHTHYSASALSGTITSAAAQALVENVIEHYNYGSPRLYINRADEATFRGFTNFVAYPDPRIVPALTSAYGRSPLDFNQLNNRAIGIFYGAEVWVKPWIPQYYLFAFVKGAPKTLCMRAQTLPSYQNDATALAKSAGLQMEYEDEEHPLRTQGWYRTYGFGVWNRTNGAVLYTNSGTYAVPTISF